MHLRTQGTIKHAASWTLAIGLATAWAGCNEDASPGAADLQMPGMATPDLAGAAPPCATAPLFPSVPWQAAAGATTVVAADFNGDGVPDLVTGDSGLSVFVGLGNGTFQSPLATAIGAGSPGWFLVRTGDLDRDGKIDVIAVGAGIRVLLGKGDGHFQPATDPGAAADAVGAALADWNGDGKLDLAFTSLGSDNVTVLLGNGDGTFHGNATYAAARAAYVESADVNADGKADLVLAGGSVFVLLGQGDGTFGAAVRFPAGKSATWVRPEDLDHDGKIDLVAANNYTYEDGPGTISVLKGNGDGTFAAPVSYPAGGADTALVLMGDLDGDGNPDVIAGNTMNGSGPAVLLGKGDGTFRAAVPYPLGNSMRSMAIADFNGDHHADLAVVAGSLAAESQVGALLGRGDGTFQVPLTFSDIGSRSPVAADFDGDGRIDIATLADGVYLATGKGDGTFKAPQRLAAITTPSALIKGDFNGDGKLDLAAAAWGTNMNDSGSAVVLLGAGNGSIQAPESYAVGAAPMAIAAGDWNGDGKLDLTLLNDSTNDLSTLVGNGDGTFQAARTDHAGAMPRSVVAGDWNGDGKTDIAVENWGDSNVSVLIAGANGVFGAPVGFRGALCQGNDPCSIVSGDWNGDGKLDLAANGARGAYVLLGKGDGTFQAPVYIESTTDTCGVGAGDWNGDGKADLAATSANDDNVTLFFGQGDGTFAPPLTYYGGPGRASCALASGDFDGNGRLDLITGNAVLLDIACIP